MVKKKVQKKKEKILPITETYFIAKAYSLIPCREMTNEEMKEEKILADIEAERIIEQTTDEDWARISRYGTFEYLNGGKSFREIAAMSYPPQLEITAKLYFEVFEIDEKIIPNPHNNADSFAYWCKDLEKIKFICGKYLSDSLVRAKRNYDNRHDKGFELDHPGTIFKILETALKEITKEREMLFVPEEIEEDLFEKQSLGSLRNIFDEE